MHIKNYIHIPGKIQQITASRIKIGQQSPTVLNNVIINKFERAQIYR